ncbi:MAG: amidohydrolase [Planctomycetota bacterium]
MSTTKNAAPAWLESLQAIAQRRSKDWIEFRRYLHQHPELSGKEVQTTLTLNQRLANKELPTRVCSDGRGLTADLVTDPAFANVAKIAIRGDIDALPIMDEKVVPYRSSVPGVMHACGHDVHATAVVGAIELLAEMHRSGTLPWPIAARAILQPAEETCEGASHMIHNHALAGVDSILALHVDPTRQVGCIGLREGILTASCDLFEVVFVGTGGHGARPHLCTDPIEAAAVWIQSAYRRVGRTIDAHETVVLSIGQIQAGHSANVIPDSATIRGTMRSLSPEGRRELLELLEDVGESAHRETGCKVRLKLGMSAPAVVNASPLIRLLHEGAAHVLNPAAVEWIPLPSMGSEDFSYYLEHVPGAMFRLGVAGGQVGSAPLHTGGFDIDEQAIECAVKLFAGAIIQHFDPEQR